MARRLNRRGPPPKVDRRNSTAFLALFCEVRAGLRTAKDAAKTLGMSRQKYYKWEERVLKGAKESLDRQRQGGRPKTDPLLKELEEAKSEISSLRKEVEELKKTIALKDEVASFRMKLESKMPSGAKKNSAARSLRWK